MLDKHKQNFSRMSKNECLDDMNLVAVNLI